ncbi:GALDH-like protein [Mya arenaria]|uniref:GALDH-like protein n=1 Tax=Mya arenaria TaxID=6604 RepID=A0ABY7DDN0_MYAAR|nr:GALDH-like protein [Mya arenaria]
MSPVLSAVWWGASSFGSVFRSTDDSESVRVLETAIRSGVNLVDVAPWYGHGKAESVLGKVHDMEFAPSLDLIINETLPALQKVKDAGKARFIGITGYPLENFRYMKPLHNRNWEGIEVANYWKQINELKSPST